MTKTDLQKKINEELQCNDLLKLIDDEFDLVDKIDRGVIDISELETLIEDIENLDLEWYDYLNIPDEGEYRVIPDYKIEDLFYNETVSLVEEWYFNGVKMPAFIEHNIDRDWIVDWCMSDGWYWHRFNSYDWAEIEWHWFYLFRS